jgi:hypothetical protein
VSSSWLERRSRNSANPKNSRPRLQWCNNDYSHPLQYCRKIYYHSATPLIILLPCCLFLPLFDPSGFILHPIGFVVLSQVIFILVWIQIQLQLRSQDALQEIVLLLDPVDIFPIQEMDLHFVQLVLQDRSFQQSRLGEKLFRVAAICWGDWFLNEQLVVSHFR